MYELLHTGFIKSEPIQGIVFYAQLLSGELHIGGQLATPIGDHGNVFALRSTEWDSEVYTLNVGPIYEKIWRTSKEAKTWLEEVVKPWQHEQKKKHIDQSIVQLHKRINELVAEGDKLDGLDNIPQT